LRAKELASLGPDLVVTVLTPVTRAIRDAAPNVPIVFTSVSDPIGVGFVESFAHPGGNITGFTFIDFEMVGKWLEILKEAAPAFLVPYLCSTPTHPPIIMFICVRSRPCHGQSQLK